MAETPGHALFNLDRMLVAFLQSETNVSAFDGYGSTVSIVPGKYDISKPLPIIICSTDRADRGRSKNWTSTGSISVRTPLLNDQGVSMEDESSNLEFEVLRAFENYVPIDDLPQPLCAAINSIAATEGYADFMLTNFQIMGIDSTEDEDCWIFAINFKATVLNDGGS
jgi:hypothetical protein